MGLKLFATHTKDRKFHSEIGRSHAQSLRVSYGSKISVVLRFRVEQCGGLLQLGDHSEIYGGHRSEYRETPIEAIWKEIFGFGKLPVILN